MADYNDTPDFDFSDIPGYDHLAKFVEMGERAERQAKIKEDILFAGQDNPPMAELEIIFDNTRGKAGQTKEL